ncbi:MAG: antirestriction protein ArdA [bacterium]
MCTLTFYAQPYNIDAEGFYFTCYDEYKQQVVGLTDRFGQPVEEFDIQFIDGSDLDCAFAQVWHINQANIAAFIEATERLDTEQKIKSIIAITECGYDREQAIFGLNDLEIDLYFNKSMKDLAETFAEEGVFGEIPDALRFYIDLEAIARDLAFDYTETSIAEQRLIYRAA